MADILIRGYKAKEQIEEIIQEARYAANNCMIGSGLEIVELPEHGDLIDRDALLKQMGITDMDCYKCEFGIHGFCGRGEEFCVACEAIEDAPVVIPADKEETE